MRKISLFNCLDITLSRRKRGGSEYEKFIEDYNLFKKELTDNSFQISNNRPFLNDKYESAGETKSQYFIQDLYVAQQIFIQQPIKHVDIGSRIDGFVAHVATFRAIELFDIRPIDQSIKNIVFTKCDITDENNIPHNYCDSISCLHALEHFGLGRYGDSIDANGHIKGFINITRILNAGGTFYLSVPIGKVQRIEFNAHRIFNLQYLIDLISTDYFIISISIIDDNMVLHENIHPTSEQIANTFNLEYGTGIFILKKK